MTEDDEFELGVGELGRSPIGGPTAFVPSIKFGTLEIPGVEDGGIIRTYLRIYSQQLLLGRDTAKRTSKGAKGLSITVTGKLVPGMEIVPEQLKELILDLQGQKLLLDLLAHRDRDEQPFLAWLRTASFRRRRGIPNTLFYSLEFVQTE